MSAPIPERPPESIDDPHAELRPELERLRLLRRVVLWHQDSKRMMTALEWMEIVRLAREAV